METALDDATPLLTEDVDVLSLQNGLGNPETIANYVPRHNVIAGVTTQGTTLEHARELDRSVLEPMQE